MLGRLPATYRNTPSCPGCLALTLTLRPDGAYLAREQLGSSEFYDFGRWRESREEGALQLAGGRDGPRGYAVRPGDRLEAQPGTQGGDLKRAAALETLRGPFNEKRFLESCLARARILTLNPLTDPKQVANAVRFRAQEALPIPTVEAVLDYQLANELILHVGQQRLPFGLAASTVAPSSGSTAVTTKASPGGYRLSHHSMSLEASHDLPCACDDWTAV